MKPCKLSAHGLFYVTGGFIRLTLLTLSIVVLALTACQNPTEQPDGQPGRSGEPAEHLFEDDETGEERIDPADFHEAIYRRYMQGERISEIAGSARDEYGGPMSEADITAMLLGDDVDNQALSFTLNTPQAITHKLLPERLGHMVYRQSNDLLYYTYPYSFKKKVPAMCKNWLGIPYECTQTITCNYEAKYVINGLDFQADNNTDSFRGSFDDNNTVDIDWRSAEATLKVTKTGTILKISGSSYCPSVLEDTRSDVTARGLKSNTRMSFALSGSGTLMPIGETEALVKFETGLSLKPEGKLASISEQSIINGLNASLDFGPLDCLVGHCAADIIAGHVEKNWASNYKKTTGKLFGMEFRYSFNAAAFAATRSLFDALPREENGSEGGLSYRSHVIALNSSSTENTMGQSWQLDFEDPAVYDSCADRLTEKPYFTGLQPVSMHEFDFFFPYERMGKILYYKGKSGAFCYTTDDMQLNPADLSAAMSGFDALSYYAVFKPVENLGIEYRNGELVARIPMQIDILSDDDVSGKLRGDMIRPLETTSNCEEGLVLKADGENSRLEGVSGRLTVYGREFNGDVLQADLAEGLKNEDGSLNQKLADALRPMAGSAYSAQIKEIKMNTWGMTIGADLVKACSR